MIATLRGTVIEKGRGVIIECAGVGYGVLVTSLDFDSLRLNQETVLYIHEHIKEDAHDLYGFVLNDTKVLFEQLLSVKNVGPKVGLAVLDIGTVNDVKTAISQGDVKRLQTAKGVGKRAAEQIIVELRDKVGVPVGDAAENLINRSSVRHNDEALQALVALGYSEADALAALQNIEITLPVEERIKQALKVTR